MKIEFITAIFFGIVYLVFAYALRKTSTFDSFAVGDRNMGKFIIFASLSATIVGPGFSLGIVSEGYKSGLLYAFLASAYGIQMIIVGYLIAPRIRTKFFDAYSLGDIVGGEHSHKNTIIQIMSGIISFLICAGVTGILIKTGGDIFNVFLNIPKVYGAVLMTIIVIIYEYYGGIKASILTDVLQFLLFVVMLPLLFIMIMISTDISVSTFLEASMDRTENGVTSTSIFSMIGIAAWFAFGDVLQPPLLNRILASRDGNVSKSSFIQSGLFVFFWLVLMVALGITAYLATDITSSNDNTLLILGKNFFPPALYGFFIVAILGIVMSSQSALINAGATVFSKDIVQPFSKNKSLTNSQQLIYSKLATILIGVIGLVVSFVVPSILGGLLFIASLWAPTMIVTILASIFLNKHYWQASLLSMVFGFASSLAWTFTDFSDTIPSILIGLTISLVCYFVVHLYYQNKHI
jgi:SSS family solute:Na+ symporter